MSPITTWIFPGQGSQAVGMGNEALAASPAARAVLAEAEEALGESIGALIATGPAEALERTEQAQPAILIISIALLEAARERAAARGETLETPILAAGHSAGQYAAAVAAGALSIGDAVKLSRKRGELMQTSGGGRPGAMAAILGLPETEESRIVAEGAAHGVRSNVICPGFVRTPLVDKQIPEQAAKFGITEAEVIKNIMLKDTVDGEFTTVQDVAEVALMFAAFPSNALTGQSLIVSHGWTMQ